MGMVFPSDLDCIEAGVMIDNYCDQAGIPTRIKYRIHLVFEELVQQMLMPRIDNPSIEVRTEYIEKDKRAEMTVKYNGEHFDPADSDNELSYKVLKSVTSDLRHTTIEEDEYTNQIDCAISE